MFMSIESPFLPLSNSSNFQTVIGMSAYVNNSTLSNYATISSLSSINSDISTLNSNLNTTNSNLSNLSSSLSGYQLTENMISYLTSGSLSSLNSNVSSLNSNLSNLSSSLSAYQEKGSYLSASESINLLYKDNLSAGPGINITTLEDKTQINVPSANLYLLGLKASATSTASLLTNPVGVYFDVLTGSSGTLSASFIDNHLYFLVS
jgi:hypothetical protein